MENTSVMSQAHLDLQARVRSASKEYAQSHMWCRNPQSRSGSILFPDKPRVNILIRPAYAKNIASKPLVVGGTEVLFHIFGAFDDAGFVADPRYRILCGPKLTSGLVEMIDAKLDRCEPEISFHLYRNNSTYAVRLLYESVRDSIICMRASANSGNSPSDYSI